MNQLSEVLGLTPELRREVWSQTLDLIHRYYEDISHGAIGPKSLDPGPLRQKLKEFTFENPCHPDHAIRFAAEGLSEYQLHTPHPRYFGLFNPAPSVMGIAADALVAAFNPQLAAWSHSPFATEVEQHLIRSFATVFGLGASAEGTFTSGGAEANLTAVLCALVQQFAEFPDKGVQAIQGQPVFYLSQQAHHSFLKAARCCGLGTASVRRVPVDNRTFAMDEGALRAMIYRDRNNGCIPFLVIATAGTTAMGVIDNIKAIAAICEEERLWCHVDAAWGGAAALVPELKGYLAGLEQADSMTFDPHKFLSIPMGAGLFLTKNENILSRTFEVVTDYMPKHVSDFDTVDPYSTSIQWSRRFIGLKVFLSLAVAGWEGYAKIIRRQTELGQYLKQRLSETGWNIKNATPLPVVCFEDSQQIDQSHLESIAQILLQTQSAWVSTVKLPTLALRACVTNYRTTREDIEYLVNALNSVREQIKT
jgi:glutamate/tyrosine decarboxylase-like PLP-dependent enzyme